MAKTVSNRRRWGGLAILSLALAIIVIDTTIINVSLRTIVGDLKTTVQTLQWVITGYALMVSAFTITGGRLGDIFGRKRMFLLGAVIFAAGSATAAAAHSPAQLLIGASIIEGFGAAMMMPATASLLLSTFHGRERAIAFGVWGGVAGAAASVGPLLGGYLTSHYSWRYAYGINIGIVAFLLLFSWLIIEARETDRKPSVDFLGILLSAAGLAAVVYGIVQSSTYGWIKVKEPASILGHTVNLGDYSIVIFALILGLLLLVIFGLWQVVVDLKGRTPLITPKLIANSRFTAGVATMSIMAMGQFGMFFTLPVFFQAVRGLDAFHTGLALLPFSLSVLVAAPLSGAVISRILGIKWTIVLGLAISVTGMVYLRQLLSVDATQTHLIPALIVNGFGFGMAISNLANITLSAASVQEAGEASGINNTARQLGATLGTAVLGAVMLSTIQTSLVNSINSSSVIPSRAKPAITSAVPAQVQSLGQGSAPSSERRLPPVITNEIHSLSLQAMVDGVRKGLYYGAVILAAGFLLSLRLPSGAAHAPQPEAAQPVPVVDSSPRTAAPKKPIQL